MHLLIQGFRSALKTRRKSLALVAAVAVLTVELGVGGTTAIYSIVRGVLWRPPPYDNYERLVHMFEVRPGQGPNLRVAVAITAFEDWKQESRLLEDFACLLSGSVVDFILAGEGGPDELMVFRISADAMRLVGALAAVALILALIGIYGTLAHAVARRTREIGVRFAIGEQREDIARWVVGQAAVLALAGVAVIRMVLCWLEGNIHGVERLNLLALPGVAAAVALASLLASHLPARRAMAVDPKIALRQD